MCRMFARICVTRRPAQSCLAAEGRPFWPLAVREPYILRRESLAERPRLGRMIGLKAVPRE